LFTFLQGGGGGGTAGLGIDFWMGFRNVLERIE